MNYYSNDSLGIMSKSASVLGIIGALCFAGVGFTPHNLFSDIHIIFVNWAFRSFLIFKEEDITFDGESLTSYEDTKTEHGRTMISQFCSNCGTQIGINAAGATGKQHISIGSLDQRKNINITDNIWAQEALQFVTFPKDDDVYKNRYDNGTGEKIKRE